MDLTFSKGNEDDDSRGVLQQEGVLELKVAGISALGNVEDVGRKIALEKGI